MGEKGGLEAGQGLGGVQGLRFGSGGVGGRGTGPRDGANFATGVVFLLFLTRTKRRKMFFFEGCPVGWAGVPTGAGLDCRGRGRAGLVDGGSGRRGKGLGGGCKGFGSGGVSGRDTGPRDGANFATCVSNAYKKKRFLKDALRGGGGVPTGAGLVDGEVDPGPWFGGGVGAMAVPNKGGLGLGWLFQRGASPGKGSGKGWLGGRGGVHRDGANSAMFTVPCDALNTA